MSPIWPSISASSGLTDSKSISPPLHRPEPEPHRDHNNQKQQKKSKQKKESFTTATTTTTTREYQTKPHGGRIDGDRPMLWDRRDRGVAVVVRRWSPTQRSCFSFFFPFLFAFALLLLLVSSSLMLELFLDHFLLLMHRILSLSLSRPYDLHPTVEVRWSASIKSPWKIFWISVLPFLFSRDIPGGMLVKQVNNRAGEYLHNSEK